MATETKELKNTITPVGIATWCWLAEPRAKDFKKNEELPKPRYELTLCVNGDEAKAVDGRIDELLADIESKRDRKECEGKLPVVHVDDFDDDEWATGWFKGGVVIKAWSYQEPEVVDAKMNEFGLLTDKIVYAGMQARMSVRFYYNDKQKCISGELCNVQKKCDGEKLNHSKPKAQDEFGELDDGGDSKTEESTEQRRSRRRRST